MEIRFHIDGLQLMGGANIVSQVELKHKRITEEIMQSSAGSAVGNVDFPEDALTEDEKCALLFTLSHTVNETARHDEDLQHTYQRPVHVARGPVKPDDKSVNPTPTKRLNTSQPIQSEFLSRTPSQNKSVPQPVVKQQAVKTMESKQQSVRTDTEVIEENEKRVKRADTYRP